MKTLVTVKWIRSSLENLALVLTASILFAASNPNIIFTNGLPLLAWVSYAPIFYLVRRIGLGASVLWGAFYGYLAYGLYNYWLSVFHPLAGLIVGSIYLVYMAILFPLLRLAILIFPRRGYLLQWLLWLAYEYLRTLGFLGYSYGITGYSQWNLLPIIQIAAITGVWGVSALVVFPSAWFAAAWSGIRKQGIGLGAFFRREWLPVALWFILLTATLVYGFVSPIDYSEERKFKVALIQHNTDPWEASKAATAALALEAYRNDFLILSRLSDEALAAHPDTDLVVWSETAFVPRIYWHTTYRDNPGYWRLVTELLEYLRRQDVPFIIGNDDARRDPVLNPTGNNRVNYNAALLFERGEITGVFRKLHLVPFTEHFPYERQFPWIHKALINADTHFWEKGTEATVFETGGVKFSTPICFEDTFGYISRNFVRNGAELIVNLSNDAWSGSLSAQMQHLSMAIFRAVENRRSMVRSTASGQTAAIDPNGRILAMAEAFTESFLVAEVPVLARPLTFYTRHGDYLGKILSWTAFLVLISGFTSFIIHKRRLATK
jgi:apolipoprotein N-acyltransferase